MSIWQEYSPQAANNCCHPLLKLPFYSFNFPSLIHTNKFTHSYDYNPKNKSRTETNTNKVKKVCACVRYAFFVMGKVSKYPEKVKWSVMIIFFVGKLEHLLFLLQPYHSYSRNNVYQFHRCCKNLCVFNVSFSS